MQNSQTPSHGMSGLTLLMYRGLQEPSDAGPSIVGAEALSLHGPDPLRQTFGRIAPPGKKAPPHEALVTLATAMGEDEATAQDGPAEAGMAFLGQFIDHDLTLDATTELGKSAGDPERVRNFRTPRLDLDCVYGAGPEVTPYLYDGPRLIFGRLPLEGDAQSNPLDLPRNRRGTALIGDPRNDENLFVSQVHGRMFIDRHNRLVEDGQGSDKERYEKARQSLTIWYHRFIIERLLPQIVVPEVLSPLVQGAYDGALPHVGLLDWRSIPDMPVEFSAAAYRFGHSMIRQTYRLNNRPGREAVAIFGAAGDADTIDLRGFHPVAPDNVLDMDLFFGDHAQLSRPIDTHLPQALLHLPTEVVGQSEPNLALRNLDRGQITFRLPSGEEMADFLGVPQIAPDARIVGTVLEGNTPLWYYILAEAEANGGKLGAVGGTLVAGVLLNLMLRGDSPLLTGTPS